MGTWCNEPLKEKSINNNNNNNNNDDDDDDDDVNTHLPVAALPEPMGLIHSVLPDRFVI
jgi:hypothetical protein